MKKYITGGKYVNKHMYNFDSIKYLNVYVHQLMHLFISLQKH